MEKYKKKIIKKILKKYISVALSLEMCLYGITSSVFQLEVYAQSATSIMEDNLIESKISENQDTELIEQIKNMEDKTGEYSPQNQQVVEEAYYTEGTPVLSEISYEVVGEEVVTKDAVVGEVSNEAVEEVSKESVEEDVAPVEYFKAAIILDEYTKIIDLQPDKEYRVGEQIIKNYSSNQALESAECAISYSSSDTTIVDVSEDGSLLPKRLGTATVTVSLNYSDADGTGNSVTVEQKVVVVDNIDTYEPVIVASGVSNKIHWTIDENGVLLVTGEGDYKEETYNTTTGDDLGEYVTGVYKESPWKWEEFDTVKIKTSGMTNLKDLFYYNTSLRYVDLSEMDMSKLKNAGHMFESCKNLYHVKFPEHADLSSLENAEVMFNSCNKLQILDCSGWKTTSALNNIMGMFSNCKSLVNLDIRGLNTSGVTNMEGLFVNTEKLPQLDISNMNTSKVTNMSYMFAGMRQLKRLDTTNLDTSRVTDFTDMFSDCENVKSMDISKFDTSNGISFSGMFRNMKALEKLDVSTWDTSKAEDMSGMFFGCAHLKNLDVSHFNTSKVKDMSYMFGDMFYLENLDVSALDTSEVVDMQGIFYDCMNVKQLELSSFDTSKVTDMSYMFYGATELTELDVPHFDTSNVRDMSYMFYQYHATLVQPGVEGLPVYASKIEELDVSNFDTSKVANMTAMFAGCSMLKEIDITGFVFTALEEAGTYRMFDGCQVLELLSFPEFESPRMGCMFIRCPALKTIEFTNTVVCSPKIDRLFEGCSSLENLDTSKLDVSRVTDMSNVFKDCTSLEKLDVSSWNTSNVTTMKDMFSGCENLKELDLSKWNTHALTTMEGMFRECVHMESINMSGFDTVYLESLEDTFYNCNNLKSIIGMEDIDVRRIENIERMLIGCESLTATIPIGCKGSFNGDIAGWSFLGNTSTKDGACLTIQCQYGVTADEIYKAHANTEEITEDNLIIIESKEQMPEIPTQTSGAAVKYSGQDGCIVWSINEDGFLLIEGYGNSRKCGWLQYAEEIKHVKVDVIGISNMTSWFRDCNNLVSVDFSATDLREVVKADELFFRCHTLKEIIWQDTGFRDLEYVPGMYAECVSLENINTDVLSNASLCAVQGLFNQCYSVKTLDLSKLNISRCTDLTGLVYQCFSLESLNLSGLDTSNVTDLSGAFRGLYSLKTLDLSTWDTSNVTNMSWMFAESYGIENFILTGKFSTENVTDMHRMFSDCQSAKTIDVSNFNTSKVESMANMFDVLMTNDEGVFKASLESIDLSMWDTSNVTDMSRMFRQCENLKYVNVRGFDTTNVYNMAAMFFGCKSLEKIDGISGFDTAKTISIYDMFYDCYKLNMEFNIENPDIIYGNGTFYFANFRFIKSVPARIKLTVPKEWDAEKREDFRSRLTLRAYIDEELGDSNFDGAVTLADAQTVLRKALLLLPDDRNTGTYAIHRFTVCDVNRDDKIELTDATLVLRRALLLIDSFYEKSEDGNV